MSTASSKGPTPSPRSARLLGTVISGRYRLESVISESDTNTLYRAEHTHMRKKIAVKILSPQGVAKPDALARFEREAMAGAHVDHPNVAVAKDFGALDDGSQFFVVELLDGPTLRQEIAAGPMKLARAARIIRQIALALDAAHTKGIVHRALCPETIHVLQRGGESDVVKLVDFGWAKLPPDLVSASPADRAARVAAASGAAPRNAAPYQSPELSMGADVDGRSDLYSLGLILYELLQGRAPAISLGPAPPLTSGLFEAIPPELDAIARRLVARSAAARVASAVEVVDALEVGPTSSGHLRRGPLASEIGSGATMMAKPGAAAAALSASPAISVHVSSPVIPIHGLVELGSSPAISQGALGTRGSSPNIRGSSPAIRASMASISDGSSRPSFVAARPASLPLPGLYGLPTAIQLAITGATAIVLLVLVAIAVRSPIPDEAEAAAATASASAPKPAATATSLGVGPVTQPAVEKSAPSTAAPAPPPNARELKKRFLSEVQQGKNQESVGTLVELLKLSPKSAEDADVKTALLGVSQRIMLNEGDASDRLYDLLAGGMGTVGADLLFELVTTKGGTQAAKRAAELLEDAAVRARGSPALRIAYELRMAKKCSDKKALLGKAKQDGDFRAYGMLQQMNKTCKSDLDCCLRDDPALKAAMESVRARMR